MPFNRSIVKPSNARRWATIQQAAKYIDVNAVTIRKLIAEGKLRGYTGASWRILRVDLNELDALMEQGA